MRAISVSLVFALSLPALASAEPVVKPGGKPGAATSWTAKQDAVVLEISEEYDAEEVAAAVSDKVEGASAKAKGTTVIVTGVAEAKLLEALAEIEVEPSMDDIDEMLTALKNPGGGDDEGSGSSIRASRASDFSDVLGAKEEQVLARVVSVKRHRFPMVVVTLKVMQVPKGVRGVRRGQTLEVIPRVKSRNGIVDPNDKASKLNVGAWYAVKGDRVRLRLEAREPDSDEIRVAAAFQRLR